MGARSIVLAAAVPSIAALIVLLVAAFASGRRDTPGRVRSGFSWLVVLLIGGAVVLGSYAWQSRIELWPEQAPKRFPAVAIVAVVVGLIVALVKPSRRPWAIGIVAAAAGAFTSWMFLSLLHELLISEPARWVWTVGCGLLIGLQAATLEAVAAKLPGWRAPALFCALAALLSLGATQAFASAPLILGPAAAVLGSMAVVAALRPRAFPTRGVGTTLAILICSVGVFANWFGDHERWLMFTLLMTAPLATAVCLVPPLTRRAPVVRLIAAAAASLTVAAAQVAIALPPLIRSMNSSGYQVGE